MSGTPSNRVPVTITVTETFRMEVEPDWFDDVLPESCSREQVWEAVKDWAGENPSYLWDWVDAPGQGDSTLVLTRDDTGEAISDEEPPTR